MVLDISGEVESIDGMRADRATPATQTVIPTSDVLFALDSADRGPQAQATLAALATSCSRVGWRARCASTGTPTTRAGTL